jgi:HD-GYP domain-containing protein (c-di-GMP phosphodiesterase class II)
VLGRLHDWAFTAACLTRRRGRAYDPAIADIFLEYGESWLREIAKQPIWEAVIAAEPGIHVSVTPAQLDEILIAFADIADLKSHYAAGHSRNVAEIAEGAAPLVILNPDEMVDLRRAALLHDVGKVAVPNGILDKPGALSRAEWERVRLHPYYTERILAYVPALAGLAPLAGAHHERPDGSGYHRGSAGSALTTASRLLAAANTYQALCQTRPYRPALDPVAREAELSRQVDEGSLDYRAVQAVLQVQGHSTRLTRTEWPARLTDREVEVLRLLALGHSSRGIASQLTISVKTVGRHIENIYAKTGASSRATAALFAMQHDLIYH